MKTRLLPNIKRSKIVNWVFESERCSVFDRNYTKNKKVKTKSIKNRDNKLEIKLQNNKNKDFSPISSKGLMHVDYIIAAGIFIVVFGVVVHTTISYFTTAESAADISVLTGHAYSLLSIIDYGFEPPSWNGTGSLERLGLATRAYRFVIVVNNSQDFYINQSQPVGNLVNELVSFNYSDIEGVDINSTSVYDGSAEVPYQINGGNITFRTDINANEVKYFTVYFDDDSNFTSKSTAVNGNNTLREYFLAIQPVNVIQYKKIQILNSSNYTSVKDSISGRDFRITLKNIEVTPNTNFFTYGADVPRSGNVVSMQRYSIFQNSTAGIIDGKVIIQVW